MLKLDQPKYLDSSPEELDGDAATAVLIRVGDISVLVKSPLAVFMADQKSDLLLAIARDAAIQIKDRLNALEEAVMKEPKPDPSTSSVPYRRSSSPIHRRPK